MRARSALVGFGGAAVLAAATVAGTTETPAHAGVADLTCTGDVEILLDRPLRPGDRKVGGTGPGRLSNCTTPAPAWRRLNGAGITSTFKVSAASGANPCALQLTISNVDARFTWNTGEESAFTGTFNSDVSQGMVKIAAEVKNGPLRGATGTVAPVAARPNADCLTAGLKRLDLDLFAIVFQGADPPAE